MVPAIQYDASGIVPILDDRFYPLTHPKTMSITSWAKRSPSNTSVILAVLIVGISLNLYYRDRPNIEAANVSDNGSAITELNTSPKVKALIQRKFRSE